MVNRSGPTNWARTYTDRVAARRPSFLATWLWSATTISRPVFLLRLIGGRERKSGRNLAKANERVMRRRVCFARLPGRNSLYFRTALKESLESIRSPAPSCGTLMCLERILSGPWVHPIQFGDMILANSGGLGGEKNAVAVRIETSETKSKATEAYRFRNSKSPHVPSLIVYDGRLFLWTDQGIVVCADAKIRKAVVAGPGRRQLFQLARLYQWLAV